MISDARAANALKRADETFFKRIRADYVGGFEEFLLPAKKQLMDWDQKVTDCHTTERDFFFLYRQVLFYHKLGDKEVLPRITRQKEWVALRKKYTPEFVTHLYEWLLEVDSEIHAFNAEVEKKGDAGLKPRDQWYREFLQSLRVPELLIRRFKER